jgi:hypothetical protein
MVVCNVHNILTLLQSAIEEEIALVQNLYLMNLIQLFFDLGHPYETNDYLGYF